MTKMKLLDFLDENKGNNGRYDIHVDAVPNDKGKGSTTYLNVPISVYGDSIVIKWDERSRTERLNTNYVDDHPTMSFNKNWVIGEWNEDNRTFTFNDEGDYQNHQISISAN